MSTQLTLLSVCATPRFIPFLLPIWDHMASLGHSTHIVSGFGPNLPELANAGVHQFHKIPLHRNISIYDDARALVELTAILAKVKPDLLHAHGPKSGLVGMLAATAAGVKGKVTSIHGLRHETLTYGKLTLVKNLESVSARLADRVICVSASVRQKAIADGIVSSAKSRVLMGGSASGVDSLGVFQRSEHRAAAEAIRSQLGVQSGDFVVGYIGRFARDKGMLELVQAWRHIIGQNARAHLVLMGEKDETDPIAITELLSLPSVHAMGFTSKTAPLYAAMDVLVLPSYREGFPQVLLEAAAMEVPAVATRVTGCIDAIVDGKTGVLVPAHDPVALAHEVLALLDDAEKCKKMGLAARERAVADFKIEPIARATLDLYLEVLAAN